jgi:hypothetical protein
MHLFVLVQDYIVILEFVKFQFVIANANLNKLMKLNGQSKLHINNLMRLI